MEQCTPDLYNALERGYHFMTTFIKDGVEISMPPMDNKARAAMERCAAFMAKMILKYGPEVLAEIEAEEAEKKKMEQLNKDI